MGTKSAEASHLLQIVLSDVVQKRAEEYFSIIVLYSDGRHDNEGVNEPPSSAIGVDSILSVATHCCV